MRLPRSGLVLVGFSECGRGEVLPEQDDLSVGTYDALQMWEKLGKEHRLLRVVLFVPIEGCVWVQRH
jgi:hypothetical protein